MKVNYTLPGYQPEVDVSRDIVESFDSPFKNRMEAFERQQPVGWKELLGLDQTPPDPSQVAQPESQSSGVADAALLRQQWQDFLGRHGGIEELQNSPEPVRRMLQLLQSYKKDSDDVFSRGVSSSQR
ncbi:MAG: hypothetical protein JO270_23615 [Acidobacteriaceae bacterium]|nr:hypothetical protein [Acidobacteriaceae bacterium]